MSVISRSGVSAFVAVGVGLCSFAVAAMAAPPAAGSDVFSARQVSALAQVGGRGSQVDGAASTGVRRSQEVAGFTPVVTLGSSAELGRAISAASPDEQTVFVLYAVDGQAVVQRIVTKEDGKPCISTWRLGNYQPGHTNTGVVDASSPEDVWVTTGSQLHHFDGRRFTLVKLPEGMGTTQTVKDVPGPGAFVSLGGDRGGQVYRAVVRDCGVRWQRLPVASRPDRPGETYTFHKLNYAGGTLFGMDSTEVNGYLPFTVFEMGKDGWVSRYEAAHFFAGGGVRSFTWLTPKADRHITLGLASSPRGELKPYCNGWNGDAAAASGVSCTSTAGSGKAALLADGRMVTGSFTQRPASGEDTEVQLSGDLGGGVYAMAGSLVGSAAWAVTGDGEDLVLQRYRG
ncbi:Uncharacterised protein [Dermatophilus congolensis]|uniref:Secreted protein n=1 Tax=Dermatophilus congolensis TaxID=1863 RepID=A0AA46BPZ5_9MICO|nr:hypothetical protein [Dermatophilus congolensis]STD14417.1 Uncharacterised protein [Dermatophilus congolensis]